MEPSGLARLPNDRPARKGRRSEPVLATPPAAGPPPGGQRCGLSLSHTAAPKAAGRRRPPPSRRPRAGAARPDAAILCHAGVTVGVGSGLRLRASLRASAQDTNDCLTRFRRSWAQGLRIDSPRETTLDPSVNCEAKIMYLYYGVAPG